MDSLIGSLLLATPAMADPNFVESVVLVCAHDEEGAVGVVLDRPTDLRLADHLPAWAARAAEPGVVYIGGPVQPDMALALGDGDASLAGWSPVVGTVGLIDLESADPSGFPRVRVFAGYAGWSAGQLDQEVAALDWVVVTAHPDDPFGPDASSLRRQVMARAGGLIRAYEHYPPDLRLN
jgi:putative transcriptional regulator